MTYSIPAQCQEPDGMVECQFCDNKVAAGELVCAACYVKGGRVTVSGGAIDWTIPKDNCIPATARAILDLDKPKLTPAQQQQGEGISRAIDRLNSGEHRYGFMAEG